MYALLAAALACVGASAGNLFYSGDRSFSVPFADAINRCALQYSVTGFVPSRIPELNRCQQAAYHGEGWFVAGSAVAVPLATAALVFIVPWLDRWRLSRAGRWSEMPGTEAAFGLLCDRTGLTGRLRPRLRVGGLALRQAFTTSTPGGRPLVVIPVKTALAFREPERFEPVLLHELAHVRARDVSWVSAVRGLALITIPVLALASLPGILNSETLVVQRTFLIQAGAFVAFSLLLAAALLRRREIDADRQTVEWMDSPVALRRAVDPTQSLTRLPLSRWRLTLLSRHPSLTERIAALRDPLGARDSGFAYAFAVGAITAMVIDTSYFIAWIFDISLADQLPSRVSAGAGGLMLGLGLTPALLRRAARAREAGISPNWWQPAIGTALGLFLGSLIPPSTALGATVDFFVGRGLQGIAVAGILACLGAGIATLTAALAFLAVSAASGRIPLWATALTTVAMSCGAAGVLLPVPSFNFSQIERLYLAFVLPSDQWRWLAVLYPATALVLAAKAVPRGRLVQTSAASLVTPALAGTVTAIIFFPRNHAPAVSSPATALQFDEKQWWAATFAGLAVLIVLSLSRGIPGLARACVAAWLTTVLVGVERVIYGSFTGGWHYLSFLPALLATPSVWLFYLAVPASCLALIHVQPSAVPKRQWTVSIAAGAGAAAAAVVIITTSIPALTVPLLNTASPPQPHSDLTHPYPLTGAPAPASVLSDTTERTIIARAGEALPDNWTSDNAQTSVAPAGHTSIIPAACTPFVDGQYQNTLSRPLAEEQGKFEMLPGFVDGTETLKVTIDSYAQPVPASLFATAIRDIRACHRYTVTDSAGTVTANLRSVTSNSLPASAWQAEASISTWAGSSAITWVEIGIGHNLVILNQTTNFTGDLAQPNEAVINAEVRAMTSETPPPSAGQLLTQAAAGRIASAVSSQLGPSWISGSLPAASPATITYQPANCANLAHETYLNILPSPVARAEDRFKAAPALVNDGLETLSVRVESFAQPVSSSLFAAASQIFHACPRYTTQASGSAVAGSNGPSLVTTHTGTGPINGFPAWLGDVSTNLEPGSGSVTWVMIYYGHNFILISQQTVANGRGAQPDTKVISAAIAATLSALTQNE